MANIRAWHVAQYFLDSVDDESGDNLSNLKLQKLVYYAQGFHLAITGKPLFQDYIVAWGHGPVVVDLYHQFKSYGSAGIPRPDSVDHSIFPPETREILDEVWTVYGQFSAWKLRDMTHEEPPWRDTPTNDNITHESMRNYFRTLLIDG